jgi:hypothetical protein
MLGQRVTDRVGVGYLVGDLDQRQDQQCDRDGDDGVVGRAAPG